MKKTILFCLGLVLCASSFMACSDDDDSSFLYIVDPKADVEFKDASLQTVKNALQGTWWQKISNGQEYREGDLQYKVIKKDRVLDYGGSIFDDVSSSPEWHDMDWVEVVAKDGSVFHAFYAGFSGNIAPCYLKLFVPYRIKDNVLIMGFFADEDPKRNDHYVLKQKK